MSIERKIDSNCRVENGFKSIDNKKIAPLGAKTCYNSRKYFSNVLKFMYVIHILCRKKHIENGMHGTNGSSTETHKSFSIHFGLWGETFKAYFNILILH